jgi:molybdopterin/thiamine biosynthesis adenylyltransferase
MPGLPQLTDDERARYAWQLWVRGFGEEGQRKFKAATVFISRLGGVGGAAAYNLAAAGVGRLLLAHGGNLKPADLNRQLLMTTDWIGKPRIESAVRRLRELNPNVEIIGVAENVNEQNAERLAAQADVLVDCAPLFRERFAMNQAAVRQRKPMVDCAMYEMDAQVTTILPGETPCLACLYPEDPPHWRRQFPVFGAVASTAGSIAAIEVIKLLAGFGQTLAGKLLTLDLRDLQFHQVTLARNPQCRVCGDLP